MSPSRIFILRPIATSLLMAALLLAGTVAYRQLPVSALPEVDYPTIQVVTLYPGAAADVMASSVTAPLERQFGQIPGLKQMTSSSSFGSSVITLQFDLTLDIDVAEQEVQAAINGGSTFLPPDLPNPPLYTKSNPADAPVLTLALTSATLPLPQVQALADTRLAPKIAQLPGVGLVSISGGQKPAVRVRVNPTALAAYGLSLSSVQQAIASASVNMAKGSFDGPRQASTIGANDQLTNSAEYRSVIVAYRNGGAVRLSDVASVIDDVENVRQAAWMNETPAVILNIQRQPGANIITVVDSIRRLLPQLTASLPPSVAVSSLTDRTTTIRASVHDVEFELVLTVALVVMVIFLFLRTIATTLIPAIAVPLSLVGTFGAMYLLGFSLNNLTLMALTISTGFVVDDAIVMIENIARYVEAGETPLAAALKGAEQIGFTIVSLTVSLIAVLIPLLFMGDVVGRLFREFAVTLAIAILVSAVVSLTLTPMMCARILRHVPEERQSRLARASDRIFKAWIDRYATTLRWVLRHQTTTLVVFGAALAMTFVLYVIVPKGFFPVQDTGVIMGVSETAPTASFTALAERQQKLAAIVLRDPAVDSLSSFVGVDGVNLTPTSGRIQINLKPLAERKIDASAVIRRLQGPLASVDGITLYMQPVQDLTVEDRISRTQYQYSLEHPDSAQLSVWSARLLDKMRTLPELTDTASDLQNGGLRALVVLDRDASARFGVTAAQIDDALYSSYGQRQVATILTQLNQYHVILEVTPQEQQHPSAIQDVYVPTSTGPNAPLATMSQVHEVSAPLAINHQGQFPAVTLSFNLAPGASLGSAVKAIEGAQRAIGLPAGFETGFQGTAQAFQSSLANEGWLLLAAIVTVYIVLGVLYESYMHPLTILSTLPSPGVGAILALDARAHGPRRRRADRHHPADRHRQEERDHDDRLRARCRAARGHRRPRRRSTRPACSASGRS